MAKKIENFDKAFQELQQIAKSLEDPQLPLEELATKVERAAELKDYCKKRLRAIEQKLDDLTNEES